MKKLLTILFCFIPFYLNATVYHVATTGSAGNTGLSLEQAWTPQKGFDEAEAGDTVYFHGGVYYLTTGLNIDPTQGHGATGTQANPIYFLAYPGETPIFDFSGVVPTGPSTYYNTGIGISRVEYVYFKGLTVRNVWQGEYDGFYVSVQGIAASYSANLTFENITVHNIAGRAWGYSSGAWNEWDSEIEAPWENDTTRWINCDVYDLCDTVNYYIYTAPGWPDWEVGDTAWRPGNAADGWKTHGYQGNKYIWQGCRAWNYSDDGIDPSGECYKIYDSCWVMSSLKYWDICYYEQEGHANPSEMEGNGIKMTAPRSIYYFPDLLDDTILVRVSNSIMMYCVGIALFNNLHLNGSTYVDNNAKIFNNTTYYNGTGFFENSTTVDRGVEYKNNIAYNPGTTYEAGLYTPSIYNESHNTWDASMSATGWPGWYYTDTVTVSSADFEVSDSTQLVALFTAARKADGSLPETKPLTLAATSDMIDAGVDVGLDYESTAPDIGANEYVSESEASNSKNILSYVIPDQVGSTTINTTEHTVALTASYAANIEAIVATFVLSAGATAEVGATPQVSGTTSNDFTAPVTYTIIAEDLSEQEWIVTISQEEAPEEPSVGINLVDSTIVLTAYRVLVQYTITSEGGSTVTARGVCWATHENPTTSDRVISYSSCNILSAYSQYLNGLHGGITYYLRAFATNEGGTTYSDQLSFTTPNYTIIGNYFINGNIVVYK